MFRVDVYDLTYSYQMFGVVVDALLKAELPVPPDLVDRLKSEGYVETPDLFIVVAAP